MRIHITLLFCFLMAAIGPARAQDLDEILELHHLYSQNLRVSRGLGPEWHFKEVDVAALSEALQNYRNAGILIYTFSTDTLNVSLVSRSGTVFNEKFRISEEALVKQIEETNQYVSDHLSTDPLAGRGSIVVSGNKKKAELKKSFENIIEIILPNKPVLREFDHLIIAPALNIGTLPFAGLKLSEDRYLIDEMSFSIASSLYEILLSLELIGYDFSVYSHEESPEHLFDFKKALFVANPEFSALKGGSFTSLPGTSREVKEIIEILDPDDYKLLEGKQATKENILSGIEEYDLIYLATHGISDLVDPLDKSFLVFSGNGESDSFLTAREIQELRYNFSTVDLAVLSACQTGLGKVDKGGIIGLARAFQIIGAKQVVMSLWNVDDDQTATLMSLFFQELKKGGEMLPHEALRRAMIKYRNEVNSNPKYWASFSIFGIPYPNVEQ